MVKLCECGCGQVVKSGNRFINGHNRRHIKLSDDLKKRIKDTMGEYWNNPLIHENAKNKQQRRWEDPLEHEKHSKSQKKRWADPLVRKQQRDKVIKYWEENPLRREEHKNRQKLIWENPILREKQRTDSVKRLEDPMERQKISDGLNEYYKDPMKRQIRSATAQGISLEDWTNFTYDIDGWRDWSKVTYLNSIFHGCHRHHMTETLVICIPADLHKHIYHNLHTGRGMGEMNILALQYINGEL